MISEIEQQTSDFDWFFTNNDHISFIASGGGKLPKFIAAKSVDDVIVLSEFFRNLPAISDVAIAPGLNKLLNHPIDEAYLADFIQMAERGLYAFDKTFVSNFSDTNYHLVAKPITPLKLYQLPNEIAEALARHMVNSDTMTIDIKAII